MLAKAYCYEELQVGQSAEFSKLITAADIDQFAAISGDKNPVHLDEEYAKTTRFGTRIAHGMLSAAFISAALGMQLPGPGAVYISQSLKFKAPVKIGDTLVTCVTVKEKIAGKPRVILETQCFVGDTLVTEGEALVLVPKQTTTTT